MGTRHDHTLSRSDRRGLLVLLLVVLAALAFRLYRSSRDSSDPLPPISKAEIRELEEFAAQVETQERRMDSLYTARRRQDGIRRDRLFPFNPNTADSATFVSLGLRPWQASNAIKYRRKGGRWHSPDDFARLYGLSERDFLLLRPYIRIDEKDLPAYRQDASLSRHDSMAREYPRKFTAGTVIDLNTSDTTQLKRIPGIGSYYAGKICRFRERLGGFLSVSQIRDVEGLPPEIEQWFEVAQPARVRRININAATFQQLVRHPYLNYEQVKTIAEHKRKYGPLKGWDDLRLYRNFEDSDFNRLAPYFYFQ